MLIVNSLLLSPEVDLPNARCPISDKTVNTDDDDELLSDPWRFGRVNVVKFSSDELSGSCKDGGEIDDAAVVDPVEEPDDSDRFPVRRLRRLPKIFPVVLL